MGCECLGPKKSLEQVYIKMIKQIHEEAQKLSFNEIKSPNYHVLLTQRLVKKGELRKLNDNLSSRRNKIQDAMILNYKLTSQTKQEYRWHAGLIITNSIIEVVYPNKIIEFFQNLGQTQVSDNYLVIKNQSVTKSNETGRLKKSTLSRQSAQTPVIGIDEQYFKIIMYLFQCDPFLKQRLYASINKYCDRHPGIISREADVWKLIDIVVKDIARCDNIQKQKRTLLFKNLLMRTKDQCSEYLKNSEILQCLFYLWLNSKKSLQQSSIPENSKSMLSIYFNRFVSAWESEFLYENIFAIFDQIEFDKIDEPLIERLCQQLVEQMELKQAFQRSMFNYLLGYMSIMQENTSAKKWLMNSLGINIENIRLLYKNPTKPHIKVQCFKRMNSWIVKKYIDIDQFCLYNSKAIIHVYASNLRVFSNTNMQLIHKQILNQFNITFSYLKKQSKIKFIQTCIQQFQSSELLLREEEEIIVMIRQIINNKIINKKQISSLCLCLPIDHSYDIKKKLEIIRLNMFLLDLIDPHHLSSQERNMFGESMYTIYQNIINQKTNFNDKYEFLESSLNYLASLESKIGKSAYVVYYSHLIDKSHQNTKVFSIQSQLCLILLAFSVRKIITNLPLPDKLQKIKSSIEQKINKQTALPQINSYFFQKDILTFDIAPPFRAEDEETEEYKRIFSYLFTMKQGESIDAILERRQSFVKKTSNSSQTSSNKQNDKSFQEVLDVICNF